MSRALVIASLVWPLLLGGAMLLRAHQPSSRFAATVYMACAQVCHQRPARSFHTGGVQWPVCARCWGLYLAAGAGALTAWYRRRTAGWSARWLVAIAAAPTALTLAVEWAGAAPVTNLMRFAAALPLGAMIAFVLVDTVKRAPRFPEAIG
jgi:uncharacterized membrane protein